MSAASRRALLGSMAAVVAAPGAVADVKPAHGGQVSDSPDAELVHLAAQIGDLERRINTIRDAATTIEAEEASEAETEPMEEQQAELIDRLCALRATTHAGLVARGSALLAYAPDYRRHVHSAFVDEKMLGALLRDLMGDAPEVVASVKADVENAHARLMELEAKHQAEMAARQAELEALQARTPEEREAGARQLVRYALDHWREQWAQLRAARAVAS